MRDGIERLGFPKKKPSHRRREANLTADVFKSSVLLRSEAFSEVHKMHGKYGLSALVRALTDARYQDRGFASDSPSFAGELTLILEGITAAVQGEISEGEDAEGEDVEGGDINVKYNAITSGTVLDFLVSRAPSQTEKTTMGIDLLLLNDSSEMAEVGEKRKGPSTAKRQRPKKRLRKDSVERNLICRRTML